MFQLKQLRKDGITQGTVLYFRVFSARMNIIGQLYTNFIEIQYLRLTLYIAVDKNIDIHCRFRSRFIVNQNFVFTFPFPFSLPFPGYCGLAFNIMTVCTV